MPKEASLIGGSPEARRAFIVMYSGNMGLAHEFDTVLDAARLLDEEDFLFLFAGEGKRMDEVREGVKRRGLKRVRFLKSQPIERLSESLASADVHLITMRPNVEGLVVPSKIYGILASGRPAAMVGPRDNEIAGLLDSSRSGIVIPNGDAAGLADYLRRLRNHPDLALTMGRAACKYYQSHLGRHRNLPTIRASLEGSLPLT
jgi:glycosyltransferase involved in cell wall biosynthesis